MHFLAFDVETGGLSPERHALTQIGAVACMIGEPGRARVQEQIALPVRPAPHLLVEEEALAVQGHTRASLAAREGVLPEREAAHRFALWLEGLGEPWRDAPFIAHNAPFDRDFLRALLRRTGGDLHMRPLLCTLLRQNTLIARGQIKKTGLKLRDCVEGIGLSQADAHEALADAVLAAHLFCWQELQQAAWRRQTLELEEGEGEGDQGDARRCLGYLGTIGNRSRSVVLSEVSASTAAPALPTPVPTRPGVTFGLGPDLLRLVRSAQAGTLPDLPGIQVPGTRQRVQEMNAFVEGTLCLIRRHVEDLCYLEMAVREHTKGEG